MISLPLLSVKSKRVRALTAGTFFLLATPQKIQSVEPVTAGITAVIVGVCWGVSTLITNVLSPAKPAKALSDFDPNCPKCVPPVKPPSPQPILAPISMAAQQTPKTDAAQVFNSHVTNNITTHIVTSAAHNTVNVVNPELTGPAGAPVQKIQATQALKPVQDIEKKEPLPAAAQIKSVGTTTPTTATPTQTTPITTIVYDHIQDIYKNHYGKAAVGTVAVGYVYILYCVSSLQRYLTDPKRISLWFSQYDLNKLLLLDMDKMQDLLVQEFVSVYNVSDQKNLKAAVSDFLADMQAELASLEQYQTLAGRIETVSSLGEKCFSPVTDIARSVIPFGGIVLDYMPAVTINTLFFVDSTLKTTVQERISRIHYYKNIFLQSTIVI